jgi:hypothetical protein
LYRVTSAIGSRRINVGSKANSQLQSSWGDTKGGYYFLCRASAIIQSVEVFDRPEDNRNVILIDTLGGDNIRITGAFFGNARHFQGYGVGQARYGDH